MNDTDPAVEALADALWNVDHVPPRVMGRKIKDKAAAILAALPDWTLVRRQELERLRLADGVYIGPIQHEQALCRKEPCDCWCMACERHNAVRVAPGDEQERRER